MTKNVERKTCCSSGGKQKQREEHNRAEVDVRYFRRHGSVPSDGQKFFSQYEVYYLAVRKIGRVSE